MQKTKNKNRIIRIPIEKLVPHPDHPNRMSEKKLAKLIRNIERIGRYEPLLVRPCPGKTGYLQIINGFHRWKALNQLDYKTVDTIVWDIDDKDTDILLATLNRLSGSDVIEKKLALIARLNQYEPARDLAKLLPFTSNQIQRLAQMDSGKVARLRLSKPTLAHPIVFFLSDAQKEIIEKALSNARKPQSVKTRAAKNAAALTTIAKQFNVKS